MIIVRCIHLTALRYRASLSIFFAPALSKSSIDARASLCDIALLAVGWKLSVPYLDQAEQEKLIDNDGQYKVFRLAVNPDLPDMGFVGFNSSFCTVHSAEMVANWLVRYSHGQLKDQTSDAEMRENIDMILDGRRNQRPAALVYGRLCSAPFHFKHLDELLTDMVCGKKSRSNLLAEQFSYPNASAYGTYLAFAP